VCERLVNHTIIVRYREKHGQLKFEFISGSKFEVEEKLNGYLSSKDPYSLMVLGGLTDE